MKKIIITSISILLVIGIILSINSAPKEKVYINKDNIENKAIAIYLEQEDGNYSKTTTFPSKEDKYILNTSKSVCNGNTNISWNNEEWGLELSNIDREDTKCFLYFDKATASDLILANEKINDGTPDFSQIADTDEGVFQTSDGMYGGTTYYWRGATTTNHVIFANKCWRIVRINGDKTMRLIYNGDVQSGNTCTGNGANSSAVIMGSTNAEKYYATSSGDYNNSSYVGWTYSLGSQRTLSGTPSNAKTQTEKWYSSNITGTNAEKVADGKFCNDRNTQNNETWHTNSGTTQYYAGHKRLYTDYQPTFSCNSEDMYTLKVGAITADEVTYAGGKNGNNTLYYMYTGQHYWTMSPCYWSGTNTLMFFVDSSGSFSHWSVGGFIPGLRPVINLRSDITFEPNGIGTSELPYVVK